MNKIRVIDLLNKIANGEEVPKEIEYSRKHYYLSNNHDIDEFGGAIGMFALNDEIEILDEDYIEDTPKEDKKIEKLGRYADVSGDFACEWTFGEKKLKDKINEIIDKVNGEDNGKYME